MSDLVYLDTETTGLDPELHEVWEIAWAVNDDPVQSTFVPHSLATADPKALELNGYWDRADSHYPDHKRLVDLEIRKLLTGNTLVGANPAFDAAFLRKRWGVAPWHYRMIDVESMALGILGYDRPKGLAELAEDLVQLDYDISLPDHTAETDVIVLRDCYRALCNIRQMSVRAEWRIENG
jgi:DNA polymerase III alpha subunit (gram-positive type)